MPKPWILLSVAACLGLAAVCFASFHRRLARMESSPLIDAGRVHAIDAELARLEDEVQRSIAGLRRLAGNTHRAPAIDQRLGTIESELQEAACAIDEQRAKVAQWEGIQNEVGPRLIDERLSTLRNAFEQECKDVDAVATHAAALAQTTKDDLEHVEKGLLRDKERMWKELLGPTVQLMGEETVGSGVLLASEQVPGTEDFTTYVITAWHVIRDIQTAPDNVNTPVAVTIYGIDGKIRPETAQLLKFDAGLDIALLKLNSNRPVECGAKLAPRAKLADVRIFEQIYAVGCPLGNDPIPTFGEIADTHHVVDGQGYWMISAPTYIGNSGGGVFDAETHELLGIFTKIYTHGTLRPTVVPHMGLATPLPAVYDWLDQIGFAKLEPAAGGVKTQTAAAKR
jgi:S1-C subfamily serine protease